MRQRIVFAAALGIALGIGIGAALAEAPGYYITGTGGVSLLPKLHVYATTAGAQRDGFDTGYAAGGALGYATGTGLRIELSSLHQQSEVSTLNGAPATGHLSSTSVMANATYDLASDAPLTPYVGAGVGMMNVGGQVNGFSGRDWTPAYQAEAGLRSDVGARTSLFGEYRFMQSGSVTLASTTDTAHQHFSDHALLTGLSFKLN